MAIYAGVWVYKDVKIMLMVDPNRWRATILGRSKRHPEIYSRKLKCLHDRDNQQILKRAFEWVDSIK